MSTACMTGLIMVLVAAFDSCIAQTVSLSSISDARMRVYAPSVISGALTGNIIRNSKSNELVMLTFGDDAHVRFPFRGIERLEVSEGHSRAKYAAIGAGAGLLLGAVAGASLGKDDPSGYTGFLSGVIIGGVGIPLGAAAGYVLAPENWKLVSDDHQGNISPPGTALRAGAMVRIRPSGQKAFKARVAGATSDSIAVDDGAVFAMRSIDRIEVRGDRNRKKGIVRGAVAFGGIALVFGGIDTVRREISAGEWVSTTLSNAMLGGFIGSLLPPRGWQEVPIR